MSALAMSWHRGATVEAGPRQPCAYCCDRIDTAKHCDAYRVNGEWRYSTYWSCVDGRACYARCYLIATTTEGHEPTPRCWCVPQPGVCEVSGLAILEHRPAVQA